MIEDWEIWACANLLLRQYGADAASFAARRAESLHELGEVEGSRTFRLIADRIAQLEQSGTERATH